MLHQQQQQPRHHAVPAGCCVRCATMSQRTCQTAQPAWQRYVCVFGAVFVCQVNARLLWLRAAARKQVECVSASRSVQHQQPALCSTTTVMHTQHHTL